MDRAKANADGAAILRGSSLEEEIRRAKEVLSLKAHHRRDVNRRVAEMQRAHARELGERRKQQHRNASRALPAVSDDAAEDDADGVGTDRADSNGLASHGIGVTIVPAARRMSVHRQSGHQGSAPHPGPPRRSDSNLGRGKAGGEGAAINVGQVSLSLARRYAIGEPTRRMQLLSKNTKQFRTMRRVTLLRKAREREFANLPAEEQSAMTAAWKTYEDAELDEPDPVLLQICLEEIGLGGENHAEKVTIGKACDEMTVGMDITFFSFCWQVVPRCRALLRESERGALWEEFCHYDTDNSGLLDEEECFDILAKRCERDMDLDGFQEIKTDFEQQYARIKRDDDQVDFEGYQVLIRHLREKHQRVRTERERSVLRAKGLSASDPVVAAHMGELLMFHEAFCWACTAGDGVMHCGLPTLTGSGLEAVGGLLHTGILPTGGQMRHRALNLLLKTNQNEMDFYGFLKLADFIREACQRFIGEEYGDTFGRYDRDNSGNLSVSEVSSMFSEIGLEPKCVEDQAEMKKLFDYVDEDGSGELDFIEFQSLVQRVQEKLRLATRRRENRVGLELGFSQKKLFELREIFFNLDVNGDEYLTIAECRQVVALMRERHHMVRPMNVSQLQDLHDIVAGRDAGFDFWGFLYFVKALEDEDFDVIGAIEKDLSA